MLGKIAVEWETYRRGVIPQNAPAIQIQESRRAFYAGAASLLNSIMNMLDPGTEPTERDLLRMDALHAELVKFNDDVLAGRA